MKRAFTYQDEKSAKFWIIDYSNTKLCVHFGKINSVGKQNIKEFESDENCEKEALKLISSKIKKGYKEQIDFNFEEQKSEQKSIPSEQKSIPLEQKFILKDIVYDVHASNIKVEYDDMDIILFPEVNASIEDDNVEYEMSTVSLYHNEGFNTHTSKLTNLKGKKFIWNSAYNKDKEEAGILCVQEHENVVKGTIEILDIENNNITIKWSGLANVGWNDQYGKNVPFETTFIAKLPITKSIKIEVACEETPVETNPTKSNFKIKPFATSKTKTKTKIDKDTVLEIINLDMFNKEKIKVCTTTNKDFNSSFKFKLIYCGKEYLGDVVCTGSKNNHVTNFDESSPIKVALESVDFPSKHGSYYLIFKIGQ